MVPRAEEIKQPNGCLSPVGYALLRSLLTASLLIEPVVVLIRYLNALHKKAPLCEAVLCMVPRGGFEGIRYLGQKNKIAKPNSSVAVHVSI